MDNDDLTKEEQESLGKEMSKKGISKIIKAMPLKIKIIIICVLAGIVIFLLIFIVILSPIIVLLFNDDSSSGTSSGDFSYIETNEEDNYWWPVGGSEITTLDGKEYAIGEPTSTNITSEYDLNRILIINGQEKPSPHPAIDIGSSGGTDYIISVANGKVYSTNNTCDNNGYFGNECGDGLGNYVMIEHSGSVYTIYAHLYPNSITVSQGEIVNQGQVIGKMGNSGSTRGTHLHFQIEIGGRNKSYAEKPLTYISQTDTRPVTVSSGYSGSNNLLNFIQNFEGSGPTDGDYYLVYADSGGVLTVGYGVTLINHAPKFAKHGIDVNELTINSRVKKTIADAIKMEIIDEFTSKVENTISNAGLTLEDYQIEALISRAYNTGNIDGFVNAYKEYGNTEALYDNFMNKPITDRKGNIQPGLKKRRYDEWKLFNTGIYP